MQITVSISLVLDVESEEDKNYFLDQEGNTSIDFTADLFDIFSGEINENILSINGQTLEQVRTKLSEQIQAES